jgi:hypothetical protein
MTLPRRRRCMGFVRSPAHDELWTPCLRYALPQNILCSSHLEGLEGSLLGLANVESQQRFRHVIHLQHRTRNAHKRRRHRAGAIEGDRAVREGIPHIDIALREVLANRGETGRPNSGERVDEDAVEISSEVEREVADRESRDGTNETLKDEEKCRSSVLHGNEEARESA